jgi:hypothetical protein
VLSPGGEAFANKGRAIGHMVKAGYPAVQVERMRAALALDGWAESELLPPDWRYRKSKSDRNEYNFLTHGRLERIV